MEEGNAFGAWLKEQRQRLDLTQEKFAERIGCNYDYIRKIESGTRRPSKEIAELLHRELGLPDDRLEEFVRIARGHSASVHEAGHGTSAANGKEAAAPGAEPG